MRRRRLRLHCSSDEEEEEEEVQQQLQQQQQQPPQVYHTINLATPSSSQNPNPNPNPIPIPTTTPLSVEISDDDFVDVAEEFTPPSPPAPPHSFHQPSFFINTAVYEHLLKLGLKLRLEWLDSCVLGLSSSVPGFSGLDVPGKAKLCFEQFLFSDMNSSGGGILPPNVHALHLADLPGPFVLQVDEIVNLSQPLRNRYHEEKPGLKRCLKLSMTDGVQRVFCMEYRPIKDLEVLASAGLKVAICNVNIRRGLLMLVPEVLEVLGGLVKHLDEAREKLVVEINKPPRGKRTRDGAVPSLASRGTTAAWGSTSSNDHGRANRPISHSAAPHQPADHVHTGERVAEELSVRNLRSNAEFNSAMHAESNSSRNAEFIPSMNAEFIPSMNAESISSINAESIPSLKTESIPSRNAESIPSTNAEYISSMNAESNPSRNAVMDVEEINVNDVVMAGISRDNEGTTEVFGCPRGRTNAEPNYFSDATMGSRDIDMVNEVEHPIILTGDKETPFTYLASLFANWASKEDNIPYIQGTIKCFFTGVKGFKFKDLTKFELVVYVDDGSLISEVVIDHSVVQKTVGFSPEEVTAALSSSDTSRVSRMKETMKSFQSYLVNFEGTMLLEINESTPILALEMKHGCSTSDTWLLLRRLKSSISPQPPMLHHSEPIPISP